MGYITVSIGEEKRTEYLSRLGESLHASLHTVEQDGMSLRETGSRAAAELICPIEDGRESGIEFRAADGRRYLIVCRLSGEPTVSNGKLMVRRTISGEIMDGNRKETYKWGVDMIEYIPTCEDVEEL